MMSIGRRRIVFEPHLAGLLDVEGAFGLAAVGPDLDEIADHGLHARQIKADAVEGRALLGVEGGGRLRRRAALVHEREREEARARRRGIAGRRRAGIGRGRRRRAPDLGCGAGVGSGTFSADAEAIASTVHSVAARIVVARRPAIIFSCRTGYAPPQSANRALWRIRGYQLRLKL